ncbi:serine/threonine-protein kinase 10 isoform X1 [Octopus bimaculoides]|uniref:Coiled-coil domain-containing protein 172 n=2 Tax=Octopus bimaculoides TaxID=37653 RepID=A0A0L8GX14_OCTBM|nr:serine/threonine-protein kinase 10 isoform X1 [Octopus bimaculoides]|eukprot:XP_014777275.1 PREDICTED: serine/threonine-protein kinase 10-like [Octopus bimaculoides]
MEPSFDKLFNQILEAEQIAEKIRNDSLKEIEMYEKLINEQHQKNSLLEYKISQMKEQLQEEILESKCCQIRSDTLNKQKRDLQERYETYTKILNNTKQQWRQEFVEFCNEVPIFLNTHGLMASTRKNGNIAIKREMEKLLEEEKLLKTNFKNYEDISEKLKNLNNQYQQLQHQLEEQDKAVDELKVEKEIYSDKLQKLTKEKHEVDCKPKTDPYFLGLHSETVNQQREYDHLRKQCEQKILQLKHLQQKHSKNKSKLAKPMLK